MKYVKHNNVIEWRNDQGELDREHGPAVQAGRRTQLYYRGGVLHRTDGPAAIWENGTQLYYINGCKHRDLSEGPAVINADGSTEYWEHGVRVTA